MVRLVKLVNQVVIQFTKVVNKLTIVVTQHLTTPEILTVLAVRLIPVTRVLNIIHGTVAAVLATGLIRQQGQVQEVVVLAPPWLLTLNLLDPFTWDHSHLLLLLLALTLIIVDRIWIHGIWEAVVSEGPLWHLPPQSVSLLVGLHHHLTILHPLLHRQHLPVNRVNIANKILTFFHLLL